MSYKIMCDLDDVVFDFVSYFLEFTNELFGHKDHPLDITDWNWWDCPEIDLTLDEFLYGMKLFGKGGYVRDIPVFDNIAPHILDLEERGADIYFVSDRPESAMKDTQEALRKNHLPTNPIDGQPRLILCKAKEKAALCQKLGINIVIDDKFETVMECSEAGITSILMYRGHNLKQWHEEYDKNGYKRIRVATYFSDFADIVREELCQVDTQGDLE